MMRQTDEMEADARRRALTRVLEERNLTPAELARRAQLKNPNTIYNFLNGRSASLSNRTIEAFVRVLPGASYEDFINPDREGAPPPLAAAGLAYIKGKAEAGVFESSTEIPPHLQRAIPAPYQGDLPPGLYALEVKGEDALYDEGSILFCAPYKQYGRKIDDGRGVIVHRYRDRKVEVTVQLYRDVGGETFLECGNTRIPIPADYNGGLIDINGESLEIAAVVVAFYLQEEG